MKLDIKSILILVLLVFSLFFGYKWYFSGDGEYKEKLNQLQLEYDKIEQEKKESDLRIIGYNNELDSLKKVDENSKKRIIELEIDIRNAEQEAVKSKSKFNKLQLELAETRKKIEEIKNNPPNRTGDDLLNSIKNKTK